MNRLRQLIATLRIFRRLRDGESARRVDQDQADRLTARVAAIEDTLNGDPDDTGKPGLSNRVEKLLSSIGACSNCRSVFRLDALNVVQVRTDDGIRTALVCGTCRHVVREVGRSRR
jgi:hypothetical protein